MPQGVGRENYFLGSSNAGFGPLSFDQRDKSID